MFFNRGVFIIDMFSYAVVDEACRPTNRDFKIQRRDGNRNVLKNNRFN